MMKKIKKNCLNKLFKIRFIIYLVLVCSNIPLRSQTHNKYDYKNFVVNEERYFAIPFCYLGKLEPNPLEFINYMKLYGTQYKYVPISTPGFDLKELINYNEYFELDNIWYLGNIYYGFSIWHSSDPSDDYKLWMKQFIDFIQLNSKGLPSGPTYITKIGDSDKQVSIFPPNRIQFTVSKTVQRGIKSYNRLVPLYDFFIIKCKINYIRQDSINIYMPVLAPKRNDIRNNLFFMSNYFHVPFNLVGKSKFDKMTTFYRIYGNSQSIVDVKNNYNHHRNVSNIFKDDYKNCSLGYIGNLTKYNYQDQIKYLIKYSENEINFHNIRLYFTDQELELLLKASNSSHKNKVNLYAPQMVRENIIISIREFSIPSEHELLEYLSNSK